MYYVYTCTCYNINMYNKYLIIVNMIIDIIIITKFLFTVYILYNIYVIKYSLNHDTHTYTNIHTHAHTRVLYSYS